MNRILFIISALLACTALKAQEQTKPWEQLIRKGDSLQESADNLRTELNALKKKLWNVSTTPERKSIEARIKPIREHMLQDQRAADEVYIKASRLKQDYLLGRQPSTTNPQQKNATGQTPNLGNDPEHLYQAPIATTVFQTSEIETLREIASTDNTRDQQLLPIAQALNAIRRMLHDSTQTIAQIAMAEATIERDAKTFTQQYAPQTAQQLAIYAQCLAVAQMKSRRNAHPHVREAKTEAHKYQRIALTLRNNTTPQSEGQIAFQALSFDLLAIRYLQLAYAYTWNLNGYRTRTQAKIQQLKQLLHIEPNTPPSAPPKFNHLRPKPNRNRKPIIAPQAKGLQLLPPPVYTSDNPVPTDQPHPTGVTYSLQLGAYSQPVDPTTFGGLFPVRAETLEGGRITKYYAGEFRRRAEIGSGKRLAAAGGFPDAFPVAWLNGRSISIARAQALEGKRTQTTTSPQDDSNTLFRVHIGVFPGDIPPALAQTIDHLAPGRSISATPSPTGTAYSIQPFDRRQTAENLRDNLHASGQTQARVEPIAIP